MIRGREEDPPNSIPGVLKGGGEYPYGEKNRKKKPRPPNKETMLSVSGLAGSDLAREKKNKELNEERVKARQSSSWGLVVFKNKKEE